MNEYVCMYVRMHVRMPVRTYVCTNVHLQILAEACADEEDCLVPTATWCASCADTGVPEVEMPPTRLSCSMELMEKKWFAGSCRDTESPSLCLDVEQYDTEPRMAHLGYLSRDVVGGPRCLHTWKTRSAPDEARVCE